MALVATGEKVTATVLSKAGKDPAGRMDASVSASAALARTTKAKNAEIRKSVLAAAAAAAALAASAEEPEEEPEESEEEEPAESDEEEGPAEEAMEEEAEAEEEEEEEEEDEDEKALKLLQEKIAKKQYAKDTDVRKAKVIEKLKEWNTDIIKEIGEKITKHTYEIEGLKELLKIHQNKKTDDDLIDGMNVDGLYETMFIKKNKKSAGGGGKRASPTKIVRDLPTIFKDNQVIHHNSGGNVWVAKYDLIKGDIVLISDPNVKKNATYTKVIKGQGDKNIGEIIQKNTRYTNLNQFICSHNSIYDAPKVQKECAWTGCIWRVDKEGKEIKLK